MNKKRMTSLLAIVLTVVLLVSGCQWTDTTGSSSDKTDSDTAQQEIDSTVFPKDQVIDVKISIDEADFQNMLENASAEEYMEASVNYNGLQYDHVGIRTKGNLSLRSVVNSDSDRYSFKISFDEYVNQTLNGISKINLNNNYSDASYMREFLTYELAESVGLPTPGFSYVNVYVNDELWGFYLAIEQIGDSYLQRHFDNSYGALYKAEMTGTGSDLSWLGSDPDSYTGLVMKSQSSNDDILIDMLDELNNGSDYEKVLDVDNVLKYVALNVVATNMDSYLGMNKQNYYLYENNGIFHVLPWDYNMAFGGLGSSSILIDEPTQGALSERPLIAKLLEVDEYKERYHAILSEMLEGYLQQDAFNERVEQLKELISDHVKQDPRPFFSYEEYEQALPALTSYVQQSSDTIQQQLDGTIPSAGDGSGSGGGMGPGAAGGMRPGGAGGMMPDNNGGSTPSGNGDITSNGAGGNVASGSTPKGTGMEASDADASAESLLSDAQEMDEAAANTEPTQRSEEEPAAETQAPNQTPSNGEQPVLPQMQGQNGQGELPNTPQGQMGNGFGGNFNGQMPGGRGMGGRDGLGPETTQEQGSTQEAIYVGASVLLLLLSCLFVTLYKRRRL